MLAKTKGFENGQYVEIYNTQVVTNQGDIDIAKRLQLPKDEIPKPVVKELPYIRAGTPQSKSVYEGPLREAHQKSFRKTFAAFEAGEAVAERDGIPIDNLPGVSDGIIEAYKAAGILSLEDILQINESDIEHFPMGRKLKQQAKQLIAVMNQESVSDNTHEIEDLKGAFSEFKDEMETKVSEGDKKLEEMKVKLAASEKREEALRKAATKKAAKAELKGDAE